MFLWEVSVLQGSRDWCVRRQKLTRGRPGAVVTVAVEVQELAPGGGLTGRTSRLTITCIFYLLPDVYLLAYFLFCSIL